MIRFPRLLVAACLVLVGFAATDARSILEKKVYYTEGGKVAESKFWAIFLGSHDVTMNCKFPGKEPAPTQLTINLTLLSSGYIEATGYAEGGKVQYRGEFAVVSGGSEKIVSLDSVDYVAGNGATIRTSSGMTGDLVVAVENARVTLSKLVLRIYKKNSEMGEEILKTDRETPISAFAFTRDGLQRALGAGK